MSNPLISVLMPVREFNAYTLAAIDSVLSQTHRELELLIVGNDDDVDWLSSTLPDDARLRCIARRSPGIVGALNTGLPLCSGEYIARMDSDDLCHPARLQTQLDFAHTHPCVGLIAACVDIFSNTDSIGHGNRQYQHWLNALQTPQQIREACFIESPMPHPGWFAHNDFWTQMKAYRDKDWPEDYDLVLRAWLAGIAMAKPDGVLLNWREHPERLTRTDARYSRKAFIRAKAWALTQPESPLKLNENRPVWICGTGRNARYWHDALVDNKATVLGFVELDSARPRTQKRHLPVISYRELERIRGDALVVSAISNPQARDALYSWFKERKLQSTVDFIMGG